MHMRRGLGACVPLLGLGQKGGMHSVLLPIVYGAWCMVHGAWCMVYGRARTFSGYDQETRQKKAATIKSEIKLILRPTVSDMYMAAK